MQAFTELLARLHYLNHPYLTALSAIGILAPGVFVLLKNTRSASYRVFFMWTFTLFAWYIGNFFSMLNYNDLQKAILWFQIGYSFVPFLSVGYYTFYLTEFRKKKTAVYFLLFVCLLELIYLWFSGDVQVNAVALPNVGVYWPGYHRFSYFLFFGAAKYELLTLLTAFSFLIEGRKEDVLSKKRKLISISGMYFFALWGLTEWLVGFGLPLHISWMVIPFFVVYFGYVIVHYKAMEIDTVIHRTILWLATVFILVLPGGIVGLIMAKKVIPATNTAFNLILLSLYLLFFVVYYNYLRPRIDHFFRRRKYDYQTILGKVAEKISTSINIEELTSSLLTEVSETMYLRNSLLYVMDKDGSAFFIAGRRGYKEAEGNRQVDSLDIYNEETRGVLPLSQSKLACDSQVGKWFGKYLDVLEKDQVEADPQYEEIKHEALLWFQANTVELIVPLSLENKVNALLALGKKENLQAYTLKDIDLLRKLGQEAGVTVFNALHYEDLAEKERLDQEMKMGRQIQMTLLPQEPPIVSGFSVQGLMQPAKEIGGDYYDFITMPEKNELGVVIGDVSGKGVGAGLFMAMAKTAIHTLTQEETSPKQILVRANHILHQHISGQKFMTMLYLMWNTKERKMMYSSAGHEHILVFRQITGEVESIQSGGIMLGMLPDIEFFMEEKEIKVDPGDKILLYTDGVTEALNKDGERFTLDRLRDSFKKYSAHAALQLMESVKGDVYDFMGAIPQYDDITLVVMEAS